MCVSDGVLSIFRYFVLLFYFVIVLFVRFQNKNNTKNTIIVGFIATEPAMNNDTALQRYY